MDFYDWIERFHVFRVGYYAGLPLEKRCWTATEIITDAIKTYKVVCNETDWIEDDMKKKKEP